MKRNVIIIITVLFTSCWAKKPELTISKDFNYIENKNGVLFKDVAVMQYDTIGNFIASKNIYKEPKGEGSKKIYLFQDNPGYYQHELNKVFSSNRYVYKVHVHTLGFEDSLTFQIK